MVEPEASVVAAVEAVDHVLDALDVAPVGGLGAGAVSCRGAGGLLLRLDATGGARGQPGQDTK